MMSDKRCKFTAYRLISRREDNVDHVELNPMFVFVVIATYSTYLDLKRCKLDSLTRAENAWIFRGFERSREFLKFRLFFCWLAVANTRRAIFRMLQYSNSTDKIEWLPGSGAKPASATRVQYKFCIKPSTIVKIGSRFPPSAFGENCPDAVSNRVRRR